MSTLLDHLRPKEHDTLTSGSYDIVTVVKRQALKEIQLSLIAALLAIHYKNEDNKQRLPILNHQINGIALDSTDKDTKEQIAVACLLAFACQNRNELENFIPKGATIAVVMPTLGLASSLGLLFTGLHSNFGIALLGAGGFAGVAVLPALLLTFVGFYIGYKMNCSDKTEARIDFDNKTTCYSLTLHKSAFFNDEKRKYLQEAKKVVDTVVEGQSLNPFEKAALHS